MAEIIYFRPKSKIDYIDNCIRHYRNKRNVAHDQADIDLLSSYIDEMQDSRIAMFGDSLFLED